MKKMRVYIGGIEVYNDVPKGVIRIEIEDRRVFREYKGTHNPDNFNVAFLKTKEIRKPVR